MTADATVTRVGANGKVEVEFGPPARCGGCEGACLWRRVASAQRLTFETPLSLSVGESVVVALPDRYLLVGTMFVHGLPLMALLIGALVGVAIDGSDVSAALGAVVGIAAAAIIAPRLRARIERDTLRRIELRQGARAHTHSL
jgi:sigma-E factor negative regulatory protein RseC